MPFVFDPLEEEKQKQEQQQQGGAAPAMTGGGETFGGGTAQFQGGMKSEKGAQGQGSGFVGLDKYMNANKGSGFGGEFTGKVQGSIDSAKTDLNTGAADFTNASNQSTTRWNDVQGDVKGIVDNAGDNTGAADVSKIKGLQTAKYQGPERFLDSAHGTKAQGSVQKAGQQAGALQSEGGRFALLDQFYGRPKYSMGEKTLDNLLVQNAPGVGAKSKLIDGQAKQLSSEGAQKTQELDNLAATNRQATQETAKQTRDYVGNAMTGFKSDLDSRFGGYNSEVDAYNQARTADIADDTLDADTMGLYGLEDGASLYNTSLSNYLKENPKASLGQFATDQDYARYLALNQLTDESQNYLSADDRAKAGTGAGMGRATVDKEALQRDIADAGTRYTQSKDTLKGDVLSSYDARMRDFYGPNVSYGTSGRSEITKNALESMDVAKMKNALGEYDGGSTHPGAETLREAIELVESMNKTFTPTRKLKAGTQ